MSMVASSVLLLGAPVPPHIKVAGAADVNPGSGLRARRSPPAAVRLSEQHRREPGEWWREDDGRARKKPQERRR